MIRKGLAGGSFKPLTSEAISRVHETALRIIEEVGFEVNSETALEFFERAGAGVDRERHPRSMTFFWGGIGYTPGPGELLSISMSRIPD